MKQASPLISIIVPLHNEATGLVRFHQALQAQLEALPAYAFEIIYCNDGSTDATLKTLHDLAKEQANVRVVSLSRNFGKEVAVTAGLRVADGLAAITIDGDGQHPVELLPEFITQWQNGSKVVVGVRSDQGQSSGVKRLGSRFFYRIMGVLTKATLQPNATDYRLIDRVIIEEFSLLTERNRITRGLIDWLGYEQSFVTFAAKPRLHDDPAYSSQKLLKLAIDSIVSHSSIPLYSVAILGVVVLPLSVLLGLVMVLDALLGDPFGWNVTGSGYLAVVLLFLSSIILMAQGVMGLYLTHIHSETQNRPLYVVDVSASRRLEK